MSVFDGRRAAAGAQFWRRIGARESVKIGAQNRWLIRHQNANQSNRQISNQSIALGDRDKA
jgi:hypothetical protein